MLQSVIATVSRLGIESLRLEDDADLSVSHAFRGGFSIWAVVDSQDLRVVRQALRAAEPGTAFYLLNERAVSMGSLSI
jgi:hypothetical protein